MDFIKLWSEIRRSSIWAEDSDTRIVWITLLTLADWDGNVDCKAPGIAKEACVPIEHTRKALAKFQEPDPDSRTPDNEGRRIKPVPGGYFILNFAEYRDRACSAGRAAYMKRYRAEGRDKSRPTKTPRDDENDDSNTIGSMHAEPLNASLEADLRAAVDTFTLNAKWCGKPATVYEHFRKAITHYGTEKLMAAVNLATEGAPPWEVTNRLAGRTEKGNSNVPKRRSADPRE